jgi:transposase
MPSAHRKHAKWTPGRLLNWGEKIGPATRASVQWQLDHRPHPEQGYRSCLGLLALSATYGETRLEAACRRALATGAPIRRRIGAILKANLDQHPDLLPAVDTAAVTATRMHMNVRGAAYFRGSSTELSTAEGDEELCLHNRRLTH